MAGATITLLIGLVPLYGQEGITTLADFHITRFSSD